MSDVNVSHASLLLERGDKVELEAQRCSSYSKGVKRKAIGCKTEEIFGSQAACVGLLIICSGDKRRFKEL